LKVVSFTRLIPWQRENFTIINFGPALLQLGTLWDTCFALKHLTDWSTVMKLKRGNNVVLKTWGQNMMIGDNQFPGRAIHFPLSWPARARRRR
jgi:hypothetical protein